MNQDDQMDGEDNEDLVEEETEVKLQRVLLNSSWLDCFEPFLSQDNSSAVFKLS